MKIADIKDKLPCRVKITPGFTLEESIDPGFVVDIIQIKEEEKYGEEWCYKIWFNIPPELIPLCAKIARADWLDNNRQPTRNYFEANSRLNKNGTYQDTAFVMENDDWFELYNEDVLIQVKICKDDEGGIYLIPLELTEQFQIHLDRTSEEHWDDEWYFEDVDDFNNTYGQYKTEGSLGDYTLYISEEDFKNFIK